MKKENKLKIKIISLGDNVSTRDQCESKFDVVNIRNGKKTTKLYKHYKKMKKHTHTYLCTMNSIDEMEKKSDNNGNVLGQKTNQNRFNRCQ